MYFRDKADLHLALVEESRGLKRFTTEGRARAEIEIATEMVMVSARSANSWPSASLRKGGPQARVSSPAPGRSTLITSAP